MVDKVGLMTKHTKQELLDFALKLICLHTSLISEVKGYDKDKIGSINRQNFKRVKRMTKDNICSDCQNILKEILAFKIETHFTFFWKDGALNSIKQELYNIIDEKNDLVDKFIQTGYFSSFWLYEISEYKLKKLDCELLKYFIINQNQGKHLLSENEIITEWKKYKNIYDKGALLDDDELI
jgi:hypothetical protein